MNRIFFLMALCFLATLCGLEALQTDFEEDLLDKSYYTVAFPLLRADIEEAMNAYREFLALPTHLKSHIAFKIDPSKRRSEVGYVLRTSEDAIHDDKEFFHFHPSILKREADFVGEHEIVKSFMDKASVIWDASVMVVREVLGKLEERYPGITVQHLGCDEPEVFLRFLQYHPKGNHRTLAKGHYDAGSMTLAIGESGPGLRIANREKELIPVAHQDGSAIFFLGSTFPSIVQDDYFHPAWHDVVRISKDGASIPEERWAVVCFFNAKKKGNCSWQANHEMLND